MVRNLFQEYNSNQSNWNFLATWHRSCTKFYFDIWSDIKCDQMNLHVLFLVSRAPPHSPPGVQTLPEVSRAQLSTSSQTTANNLPTTLTNDGFIWTELNRKIGISKGIWLGWSCEGINHVKLILDCSPTGNLQPIFKYIFLGLS